MISDFRLLIFLIDDFRLLIADFLIYIYHLFHPRSSGFICG